MSPDNDQSHDCTPAMIAAGSIKIPAWQQNPIDNRTSVSYPYSVLMGWLLFYQLGPAEVDYGMDYIVNGNFSSGSGTNASGWVTISNNSITTKWNSAGGNPGGFMRMYAEGGNHFDEEGYANQSFTYNGIIRPASAYLSFDWNRTTTNFGGDSNKKAYLYLELKKPDAKGYNILWSNNTSCADQSWIRVSDLDITDNFTTTGTYDLRLRVEMKFSGGGSKYADIRWDNVVLNITDADTEPPVINTVSLNTTTPNTDDLILVTVNATDNVAVTGVKAGNIALINQSGIWSGTITAIEGAHYVNVSARDAEGNIGWNNSTEYTATTPHLHHINVTPTSCTLNISEEARFHATGYDQHSTPISGLTFLWHLNSSGIGMLDRMNGSAVNFTALHAGITEIYAVNGSISSNETYAVWITVNITPGTGIVVDGAGNATSGNSTAIVNITDTSVVGTVDIMEVEDPLNHTEVNGSRAKLGTDTEMVKGVEVNVSAEIAHALADDTSGNSYVHIRIGYNETELGGVEEDTLYIYKFVNGTGWLKMDETENPDYCIKNGRDTTANHVWANVTNCSVFGLGGDSSTTSEGAPPAILSFWNSRTGNDSLNLSINTTEPVEFGAIFNQTGNITWNATDHLSRSNETVDSANQTFSWDASGIKYLNVSIANDNGTSETLRWNITVAEPAAPPEPPAILSFWNSRTGNDSLNLSVNTTEPIEFGVIFNQTGNITWNATNYPDRFNLSVSSDNQSYSWTANGNNYLNVSMNNANGTSSTTRWRIVVQPLSDAPRITSFAPTETTPSNIEGENMTFNITVDQVVDVRWQINGTEVDTNTSVTEAKYTNTSAAVGYWNVSAIATNANGSDMQTWWWTVGASSREAAYDFSTGAGSDKWAYEKQNEGSKPPSTGPTISGKTEFTSYTAIDSSDDLRYQTAINTDDYATHHFNFTIMESPSTITNIFVLWEGYGTNNPSYLYIWNFNTLGWELVGNGSSTSIDNIIPKNFTANFDNYIDANGSLHLVSMSNWAMMSPHDFHTDYVKVDITYTEANRPPSVETPKMYNSSLTERYTFEIGEKVTIRANVTDPEGAGDIDAVTITITNPYSAVMVANFTMNKASTITGGYIYEYNYTIPDDPASNGYWFVGVYANDTSGAKAAASTSFNVISLDVSLNADGPYDPGDIVSIHGRVLYANGTPANQAAVELNSTSPDNEVVNRTTVYVDSAGDYALSYILSSDAIAGMYTVEANVTKGNLQQTETATYSVKTVAKPSNIRIVTDRDVYLITPQIWVNEGDTYYSPRVVNIGVLVMDDDGMCVSGNDLTVIVEYPNGSTQTVAMTEYQDGFWNGSFTVYYYDLADTYTINATVTGEESYSGNSIFDVDRFRCDSSNCHNYELHKHGPKGAHDASAQEAHQAHSPINSRGHSGCRDCHTGQDLDCAECHTDLFRGTHADVSGNTLTERCNYCHDGYDDYTDTGIAEPVPACNTSDCHDGQHGDKPALLHQGTHADDKVDCGFCHNNMHSIFEPSCKMCHQTKDDHSEEYRVNCSICHDNKSMDYTGVKLYNSTEEKYNTTYYTNVNIHSNDLIPECTACHGSPQYTDHLGAASCIQCHENVPLYYTGNVLPENKTYYTNATIHTTNRTLILPNQTLTYNDNCEVCHYQIYGFMTPEEHSNNTNCSACHWGPWMEYQDVDQNKPIEHTTEMDRVSCFKCHTDRAMIEKSGKMRYWVNATMYNASVHGNNPGDDCVMCHTDYHPPPEYTWKWCDCCHVVQSNPVEETDRHTVTASPTTLDVTDCTACHNATSYASSINRYGGASAEYNCRWCHTYPDQEYE